MRSAPAAARRASLRLQQYSIVLERNLCFARALRLYVEHCELPGIDRGALSRDHFVRRRARTVDPRAQQHLHLSLPETGDVARTARVLTDPDELDVEPFVEDRAPSVAEDDAFTAHRLLRRRRARGL